MSRFDDVDWRGVFIQTVALFGLVGVVAGVIGLSVVLAGPLSTIVYVLLFLMALTAAPLAISLAGNTIPASGMLGRGHIVLGAFAFNHHYLVQTDGGWEWCPGDDNRVYIDGEYHEIEGGFDNKSVLGWRPFGILRYKDDGTFGEVRVDKKAQREMNRRGADTATDGGGVERGGVAEADRPPVSGHDGTWLLDLKRLLARGVRKIGDVEILETTEEVIERGQVDDSTLTQNPMITFVVTLVLGLISGFAYLYLMGV